MSLSKVTVREIEASGAMEKRTEIEESVRTENTTSTTSLGSGLYGATGAKSTSKKLLRWSSSVMRKAGLERERSTTGSGASSSGATSAGLRTKSLDSIERGSLSSKGSHGSFRRENLGLGVRLNKKKKIKLFDREEAEKDAVVVDLDRLKSCVKPSDDEMAVMRQPSVRKTPTAFSTLSLSVPCFGRLWGTPGQSEASGSGSDPPSTARERAAENDTGNMPASRHLARWWQVTLYIINEVVVAWLLLYSSYLLGVWGWALGIVFIVGLWLMNMYAAHLLWRCRNVFPGAISIGDLVYYVTKSPIAMYATFFVVNVFILLVLANQIYSAAANIYYFTQFQERTTSLFGGRCFAVFTAFIALVTVPLTQFRYLHSLTLINVLNLTCMLVFVGISLYVLLREEREGTTAGAWIPDIDTIRLSYTRKYDNLTSSLGLDVLLGAYLYQAIILEFIAEMKDPSEFPKANYWSTPIILGVTILMGAAQYQYLGPLQEREDVSDDQVLISIFENRKSPLAYVALICFSVHMLGSNVIKAVVLVRSCHLCINPLVAVQNTWRARLEWFGISVVVLVLAWALSSIVATLDLWAFFIGNTAIVVCGLFPIGVFLYISKKGNTLHKLHSLEFVSMAFCLFVFIGIMISSIAKSIIRIDKNHYQYIKNATATAVTQNFYCPSLDF
ncbi:amino acid transporter domain-containing protein [Chloropicon primus]|nr:amino acid transporter domain-containing protein [Chloropicon primus]